jgi:DNA-binding GntR family transcriptional regulator
MPGVSGATTTRQTGVDLARDTVRGMILRGELDEGSRLTLTEVAERIGTSVTPVREALRDLAAIGLIDIDAHKGGRVHTHTAAELKEIYELRQILEARGMGEVAALPEEDRVVACTLAAKLATQMEKESDVAGWATLNRDFHARLAEPLRGPWPLLFDLVESLRDRSMLPVATALRFEPALMRKANCDHRDMVAAIRDGDAKRAERVTAEHLRQTIAVLLKAYPRVD